MIMLIIESLCESRFITFFVHCLTLFIFTDLCYPLCILLRLYYCLFLVPFYFVCVRNNKNTVLNHNL